MIKPSIFAVWAAFGLYILYICVKNKYYQDLIRIIVSFVFGMVIFIAPFMIYLIVNGAFSDFVWDYIVFNFVYTGAQKNRTKSMIEVLWHFVTMDIIVVTFIIMVAAIWTERRNKNNGFLKWYLFYMIVTVMTASMAGRTGMYYAIVLVPIIAFPLCLLFLRLEKIGLRKLGFMEWIALVLIIFASLGPINTFKNNTIRSVIKGKKDTTYSEVVSYIKNNTESSDKITVFGNADAIYLLSERKSVSKYSYQNIIGEMSEKIRNEYFEELESRLPKLIVATNCGKTEVCMDEKYVKMYNKLNEFVGSHPEYEEVRVGKFVVFDRKN